MNKCNDNVIRQIDSMSTNELWALRHKVMVVLTKRLHDEVHQLELKLQSLGKPLLTRRAGSR